MPRRRISVRNAVNQSKSIFKLASAQTSDKNVISTNDQQLTAIMMIIIVIIIYWILSIANAHSWLHCIDYDQNAPLTIGRISSNYCRARPRGIPITAIFGEDNGYNYQPIGGVACGAQFNGRDIVQMSTGMTYRFLWPAKNHVQCTTPIVDVSLRLYFYPVSSLNNADPSFSRWVQSQNLFFDFKQSGKGFQNCPSACPETDRVPCFGDVRIPMSVNPGFYKAIWVWNFNPNEFYTHCMDLEILSSSTPTTRPPTPRPTTRPPTPRPTTRPPTPRPTIKLN